MTLRYRWYLLFVVLIVAGLGYLFQYMRISLFPVVLIVPIVLTWTTIDTPFYLLLWAVGAELFSTLPPGIILLITFIPWVIKLLWSRVRVDLSVAFFLLVVLTSGAELLPIMIYEMAGQWQVMNFFPWPVIAVLLVTTIVLSYVLCIGWYQLKPYDRR